ncbi:hypothetical protein K1719_004010 [Acacia pycnantha]|nr:hypothetical protein K1719_004010 [Acacia pycnantha]
MAYLRYNSKSHDNVINRTELDETANTYRRRATELCKSSSQEAVVSPSSSTSEHLTVFALRDDSVVEIQGESSGVHKAVELIATHLRKFLVDQSIVGVFETQAREVGVFGVITLNESYETLVPTTLYHAFHCRRGKAYLFNNVVYKGYLKWKVPTNQVEWKEKEMFYSVLEVKDENTASYQQYISYIFGEVAVKVHNVDGCSVVLDKITSYFIDWYTAMYQSYKGDINRKHDWWNHIEYDLRRLFRGVIKSISKLHPDHSHGNLTSGIVVLDGQAKLFNMKPLGIEGYNKDIHCLLYMISNIVDGVHPDKFFDGLDDIVDYKKKIRKLHCSKEFSIFLKCLIERKDRMVDIYHPFFWSEYQQIYFLQRVYDLLWKDFKMVENSNHWNVVLKLERCFSSQWNWVNDIPSEGAFSGVFYYENGPTWEMEHIPKAYAIAFWRHCKMHYNDHLAVGENRKTVEEIHIELNKRFNMLGRIFQAVCDFTERYDETIQDSEVFEKLVKLRNMPAM